MCAVRKAVVTRIPRLVFSKESKCMKGELHFFFFPEIRGVDLESGEMKSFVRAN